MALFDSSHVIDGLETADQDAVFEALAQKAVELGVTSDAPQSSQTRLRHFWRVLP